MDCNDRSNREIQDFNSKETTVTSFLSFHRASRILPFFLVALLGIALVGPARAFIWVGNPGDTVAGADRDGDGVSDELDNCISVPNAGSLACDTDMDGYGNACDGDLDNNHTTNSVDFMQYFLADFTAGEDSGSGSDMDCNGSVNAGDFLDSFLPNFQVAVPGASGLACAGTVPCVPGQSGGVDLRVRTASVAPIPVAPGENIFVTVVIQNIGEVAAEQVRVRGCDGSGWCGSATVALLGAGAEAPVSIQLAATPHHLGTNPHFFDVRVDPFDEIAEIDEENNDLTPAKPTFVVVPQLVSPLPEEDHDESIKIADGVALSYDLVGYGAGGAPSENKEIQDPQKGQPHPVTGHEESERSGAPPQPRIDPTVAADDANAAPGEMLEYVVKFDHGVSMPPLPDLPDRLERFGAINIPVFNQRMSLYEGVRRARIAAAGELAQLVNQAGGEVLEYFTLAGGMHVAAPKGMLGLLAQKKQVQHVEAISGGELPPDSVADGRDLIASDPYFDSGATGAGFIALLDTGIRNTHTLFTGPDHIFFEEDCVNGNSFCNDTGSASYNPDDNDWDHGTSTAAILTGNSDLGNASRGVTAGWVDSWKVYSDDGLDTPAVLRGFDQAVMWGDKIIVAEMQSTQGETGSIADAADDAFDAGSCTIAANGNYGGGSGTVASPANAHKAIGVGNYDVDSLASISSQSDGPTSDNRYKPDLQAPTNTDTASTNSNTAINNFGGTSGATPYAAGAASVFADWLGLTSLTSAAAGKIYAGLINSGPRDWGHFNNTEGVGKFELPLNGTLYYGSRNLTRHDNDYVNFEVPSGTSRIAAAIWWAEKPSNTHRDIDLYLRRPNGSTSASSLSVPSVFEHIVVSAPIVSGTRDIRIYGYSVPIGKSVTVYYAIHVE